ncbi:MAG: Rpn family recombination-promoting nuclease/putative transposase [Lachnospiraceae bacterium]|nr:Rpn family recombination-promoting nuclease/putative transposase [Lachnospiraceae bacterium]
MASKLKKYFPIIREKEELLAEINKRGALQEKFGKWTEEQREEFLNLCTGVKGLKLLYDGFFKEIMNPEYVPERLNDFLSQMLCQKVRVLKTLPADSVRIADESSLLIMDIVVELEDGSIANLEVQKVGYLFPGQRSACYSADLLLRQYKRVRGETDEKKKFSYRDIKSVYTIVFFEKSPKEFHDYPKKCYHFFEQKSNTGLEIELLQKYLFIPLDIFRENRHNVDIRVKRDAWLTLFSSDDPDAIIELIEEYPEFRQIYEEAYGICLNMERVMDMFSKELYEMDKNTTQYMIDELQGTIDKQEYMIDEMQGTIDKQNQKIDEIKKEHAKERNEMQRQEIRNVVKILRAEDVPEQKVRAWICKQYQISEEQVREFLD